jgi:outer membrane protein TolC
MTTNIYNVITKNKILILIFLIYVLFVSDAAAQGLKILNLGEAISIAKQNNSDLVVARLDKVKADEKVSEVYSENLVPTLTLSSRYSRSFIRPVFLIDFQGQLQRFEIGTDNTIATTLDVSEAIPVLGTPVFSGIRIAEIYSKMQTENVSQIESKIKADVTKAYLNVLLVKQVIELNEESLNNAQENLRVVESRYRAGVLTEFDFLRAKVKVETIKPDLNQANNNLTIVKKVLRTTIGMKTDEDIDVTGSLEYDSTEVFGPTEAIIKKITERNVAIRQLRLNKLINEELIRVDRSSFLPKMFVFGQYSVQAQENDGKPINRYAFFNSLTAGIGLSWDLNFFKNSYKANQSEIEVKKSNEMIVSVRDRLKTQSESTILRMEDAKNRIIAQKETVSMAERGVELARISFQNGVINQIDVLDAELILSQVRLAYIQSVFEYLVARTELEQLLEK